MSVNKINHILFEHAYKIESKNSHFSIIDEDNSSTLSVTLYILGMGLLLAGVIVQIWFLIAGATFVIMSVFRELRQPPKNVHFFRSDGYIQLVYDVFGRKKFSLTDVKEIVATSHRGTNLTSPFENGNKIYDYEFFLKLNSGRKVRILELEFNQVCDEDMQELAFYLNELIGKN